MNNVIVFVVVLAVNCLKLHAQHISFSAASDFEVINRSISIENNSDKTKLHIDAAAGAGIAWIKHTNFSTGTIEFDTKGKDAVQQSFIGVAFHALNDSAYDCIYFRPFNFNIADTARQNHSVQYISMPQYDWEYLRTNFPGVYEHSLNSKIEANSWFHVKVVIAENRILVYVNNKSETCMSVKPINNYKTGRIGFWVGNNSDGNFSNLILKPAE
jgi:hypothetical protein